MRYELIADRYIDNLNKDTHLIVEGLPAILLWAATAGVAGKFIIENGIPNLVLKLADENIVYQVLSIFDPTGIMAWPYVSLAMDEAAKNPNDKWKQALVIIACLGTLPGIGLGARAITRIVTFPITLPVWLVKLMAKGGKKVSKTPRMMEEILPSSIVKFGGRSTSAGVNMGNSFRKSLKEVFDINVTDDQLARFVVKNGMAVPRGLTISERALRAAKTAGKFARPAARGARTATAGIFSYDQLKGLFDKRPQRGTAGRTPDVMGPKVQFGTIGGGVE